MKRVLLSLLTVAVLLTVLAGIPSTVEVSAESLYVHKVVSVVYDDSTSMYGERWEYANYAMQAFCGMLNHDDQLFITYMSHALDNPTYDPPQVPLGELEIQSSVNSIRDHNDASSTPFEAVDAAYRKLTRVKDDNPNTQYWLVVITDGKFNDCQWDGMNDDEIKKYLNNKFDDMAGTTMPNGSALQVTFLGIGDATTPDMTEHLTPYRAATAKEITDAMSLMADQVSGRTRVASVTQENENTLRVSSDFALLNIAVFVNGSKAAVTGGSVNNETPLKLAREASLEYGGLHGGAFLLGDSQSVIGAGSYLIEFDEAINSKDVVILYEPALEVRLTVTLNGKEVKNLDELDDAMEGDEISVSYKIYEKGTDKEIPTNKLPEGTTFGITVTEDGDVVETVDGPEEYLSDFELENIKTTIKAAVTIDGLKPIAYTLVFTPTKYVPRIDYTMEASFANDIKSVRMDDIASNTETAIVFTVFADGVEITDDDATKALVPTIDISPAGNNGAVTYSDGKIVFTPTMASAPAGETDNFDVTVTCTLADGTTASETYTVLIADYQVHVVGTTDKIVKTQFFDNKTCVSFYITKDGERLGKAEVEKNISVSLGEGYEELLTKVIVAPDGTITVTPYVAEEHPLTFWSWWWNWAYYWGLPGEDLDIALMHPFGTGTTTIDVVGEAFSYELGCVWAPFALELIGLTVLSIWLYLVITKPRYSPNATLYVGAITYNEEDMTHTVKLFAPVMLSKFNKIAKGNGRLKFKKTADVVSAGGINVRADHGGRVICEMPFPWYRGKLEPCEDELDIHTPADVAEHILHNNRLEINEFATTTTVDGQHERPLVAAQPNVAKYTVVPSAVTVVDLGNGEEKRVIKQGKIFVYTNG